jgi:hypothetical protein
MVRYQLVLFFLSGALCSAAVSGCASVSKGLSPSEAELTGSFEGTLKKVSFVLNTNLRNASETKTVVLKVPQDYEVHAKGLGLNLGKRADARAFLVEQTQASVAEGLAYGRELASKEPGEGLASRVTLVRHRNWRGYVEVEENYTYLKEGSERTGTRIYYALWDTHRLLAATVVGPHSQDLRKESDTLIVAILSELLSENPQR